MRDVLMVTMPPDPDDSVVAVMQEQILDAMDRYQARGLVLDISAVETMDSYFARMVAETAHMVSLMGGRTVIAGMRPSVAVTSTQLGLSLGRATTALDVDRALDRLAEDGSMIKKR
jgi:rsbT antagonist protein RsbS